MVRLTGAVYCRARDRGGAALHHSGFAVDRHVRSHSGWQAGVVKNAAYWDHRHLLAGIQ